jgi:hypothetical protein
METQAKEWTSHSSRQKIIQKNLAFIIFMLLYTLRYKKVRQQQALFPMYVILHLLPCCTHKVNINWSNKQLFFPTVFALPHTQFLLLHFKTQLILTKIIQMKKGLHNAYTVVWPRK